MVRATIADGVSKLNTKPLTIRSTVVPTSSAVGGACRSSSIVPSARSRPSVKIPTRSEISSAVASRCVLMNTEVPASRVITRTSLSRRALAGSSPLVGSSSSSTFGCVVSIAAMCSFLRIPCE